ncbi:MAG TPA: MCP four helix bundle domain-containing protein [Chryseolinea sp.]|nr:MCP four helix bundle domain-containing protein [Chryseolinea sp.]HPM30610.1 MCP four helix bundle domain-containing protein [Chryseolinea sp.]
MKWTYSIQNKLVASGALFSLCMLVLLSNYADRDHTSSVKKSISTLYEDRLVVEDYILKMTIDIYEIKQALNSTDVDGEHSPNQIKTLLSDIDGLSDAYLKTKFTKTEDVKFAALLKTLNEFESSEKSDVQSKLEIANQALILLSELSSIQLEESKLIMKQAENLYASGKTLSQLAFAITIVILLVLQALVFASKPIAHNKQAPPHLN